MASRYTDQEIERLLQEKKILPQNYRSRIQLNDKRGHKERELDLTGSSGNKFRLILRQSNLNPLDFSIILAVFPPKSNQLYRLRRYNGKSHEHTNQIENGTFYDFHIHQATQRYQELGTQEDAYAEPADRYSDFASAVRCMLQDCGFEMPHDPQLAFFGENES
jgi:hypothetical protein